jgi:zinc and cadmium transporter
VVASSSFIYVAVADLLPQLQQRLSARETALQVAWLAAGLAVVLLAKELLHSAAH